VLNDGKIAQIVTKSVRGVADHFRAYYDRE
jgi:hypothetical protein